MKILYFKLRNCPYCIEADRRLRELVAENPKYADIEIETIDEREQTALADSYDYYYVPTFFAGRKKLHEGVTTKAKIKAVLDYAAGRHK
ncbi:MAG: thioredoxin family protein [Eubacteriales bacterium]|jgi:glutaredoxin|nr:thioredoxin family protein [Eubacteriales bacterium]